MGSGELRRQGAPRGRPRRRRRGRDAGARRGGLPADRRHLRGAAGRASTRPRRCPPAPRSIHDEPDTLGITTPCATSRAHRGANVADIDGAFAARRACVRADVPRPARRSTAPSSRTWPSAGWTKTNGSCSARRRRCRSTCGGWWRRCSGCRSSRIRVIKPRIGGGFGGEAGDADRGHRRTPRARDAPAGAPRADARGGVLRRAHAARRRRSPTAPGVGRGRTARRAGHARGRGDRRLRRARASPSSRRPGCAASRRTTARRSATRCDVVYTNRPSPARCAATALRRRSSRSNATWRTSPRDARTRPDRVPAAELGRRRRPARHRAAAERARRRRRGRARGPAPGHELRHRGVRRGRGSGRSAGSAAPTRSG